MEDVEIRELRALGEYEAAYRLIADIWGAPDAHAPVSVEMMLALAHTGNYVAGAYRDGRMVGVSVAFLAAPAGAALHSHVTGAAAGRGVGLALKEHQRDWALARGLRRITWTFDPLVRRNAHFNLAKLGARVEEYLPSFYGPMADAINGGDESDRVLAAWPIAEPAAPPAVPPDAPLALADRDGRPAAGPRDAATVLVQLPADIEGLRRTDPGAARAWRLALREVLGGLLAEGARVAGFHDRSAYVVERSRA
ncbi:GNAT family N-acetyltransferase [Actinomadura parmotrematis]|uniref:GNAT family N-acetyltransferase n=1 Tax=Actinomadura parmotrematis TaxID=2864039 RepID=A0ABS7FMS3_9ACTN|nr:GNAT family N-acetyltransferase [Actinomadura parmotrematis]MBW8481682.1 GNAT family N-acetyltransferase [Actinomadura parmotrematis]